MKSTKYGRVENRPLWVLYSYKLLRSFFHRYVVEAASIALYWVAIRSCAFESIQGIRVGNTSFVVDTHFADFVRDALDLIASKDPIRWARIRREIRYIVKAPGVEAATYQDVLRACFVHLRLFGNYNRKIMVALLAIFLVEAATNGHLKRRGFVSTQKKFRELCSREALRFFHQRLGMDPQPWEEFMGTEPELGDRVRVFLKEMRAISKAED